jgi:predicted phosphoribosyltransferase
MPVYERPVPKYRDRKEAGEVLTARLRDYRDKELIVIAIPNGGVPVAAAIAESLRTPLYLIIVRKLQLPDNPEAGFGAMTSDGHLFLNHKLIQHVGLTERDIKTQKEKAVESIRGRQALFGKRTEIPSLTGRTAVLVDDGLASGFTMEAAIESLRVKGAEHIIVAVPTASMSAYRRLESKADEIICPDISRLPIFAVANAYQRWYDVEEDEVLKILEQADGQISHGQNEQPG